MTIIGADDASELNLLSELNVGSGADALREEWRARKSAEETDFAQEFLAAPTERHRRLLLQNRRHSIHFKYPSITSVADKCRSCNVVSL